MNKVETNYYPVRLLEMFHASLVQFMPERKGLFVQKAYVLVGCDSNQKRQRQMECDRCEDPVFCVTVIPIVNYRKIVKCDKKKYVH